MKKLTYICLFSMLLIYGCGSGGGGGNSGSEFMYNSQGYPIVSGTYSTFLGKLTNNCSDAEVLPQVLSNANVLQDGNSIIIQSTTDIGSQILEAMGFTVVEESEMAGTILIDARFSSTRGLTLYHATLGNFYINYAMNGEFTPSAWSGTLGYTAFDDFGNSCTYQASFTGNKI